MDKGEVRQKILEAFRDDLLKPEVCLLDGDGHTIVSPEYYTELGIPEEFINPMIHTYKSDGSAKGTITRDGEVQKEVSGVYNLTFTDRVCNALDLPTSSKMGRGFRAQENCGTIKALVVDAFGMKKDDQGNYFIL